MFSSQAEAIRAAREFIWGDVPFAKREFHGPKAEFSAIVNGIPYIAVAANVNGRLVVIDFDQYGRSGAPVKVLDKIAKGR